MADSRQSISARLTTASRALQTSFANPPDADQDCQVRLAIIALLKELQQLSVYEAEARIHAVRRDYETNPDATHDSVMKKNTAQAAFDILIQECTNLAFHNRFFRILPIVCNAMNNMLLFAYSSSGRMSLNSHIQEYMQSTWALRPNHVVHRSSAFRVLVGGRGPLEPSLHGSAPVLHLATQLQQLSLALDSEIHLEFRPHQSERCL